MKTRKQILLENNWAREYVNDALKDLQLGEILILSRLEELITLLSPPVVETMTPEALQARADYNKANAKDLYGDALTHFPDDGWYKTGTLEKVVFTAYGWLTYAEAGLA